MIKYEVILKVKGKDVVLSVNCNSFAEAEKKDMIGYTKTIY